MRNTNKKLLSAGAVMVGLSAFVPNPFVTNEALAQATATGAVTMVAEISNPLALTETVVMKFGSIAVAGAGSLRVKVTGNVQTATVNGFGLGAHQLGVVNVKAPVGATFSLTIPEFAATGQPTMKRLAPTDTLTVTNVKIKGTADFRKGVTASGKGTFASASGAGTNILAGYKIAGADTQAQFSWGGTVTFAADQEVGNYTGTFTMTQTF